ncbi:MAG: hypothetical protein OEM77_07255 [Nitrosopumilus sp.]|nr:hypothetical protein [Nitrosopumilus sp.]MDH3735890.1 hypothetical protein [Nitrosopumilus sp.]MDH3822951.1 hypothetical protein [Nitrosopumilus sp.]MDH3832929.1 hypothetical protein [Nitrosopumilus sp.]
MTNKTIIFGSAIALFAEVLSSGILAEAAPQPKPPDDVFVTNDAASAIPVSGLISTSSQIPAVSSIFVKVYLLTFFPCIMV